MPAPATDDVVSIWAELVGLDLQGRDVRVTRGVRDFLTVWGRWAHGRRLFLPMDVYPAYWRLLGKVCRCLSFRTLPTLDLSPLEDGGSDDTVLLPLPLSPLGRELRDEELDALETWLGESPDRTLMLDLVYAFDGAATPGLDRLRAGGQCIEIWSISKTWLQRRLFGVAVLPPGLWGRLEAFLAPPDPVDLGRAVSTFERRPEFPQGLQRAFELRWRELAGPVRAVYPAWTAPRTGYFSALPVAARDLLHNHGLAAVPASAFGSDDPDLSVITCLHLLRPTGSPGVCP